MTRRRMIAAGAAVAALGAVGYGGIAVASGGNASASGPAAAKAKTAALEHLGGGIANSVERDGENGATWEVEVTKPDGVTVDVRLDANYRVVEVESDSEQSDTDNLQDENGTEGQD